MNSGGPSYSFRGGRGTRRGGPPRGGYRGGFLGSGPAHFSDKTMPSTVYVKGRPGGGRPRSPTQLRNPSPPPQSSNRRYERITAPTFSPPRRKESPPPPPAQSSRAPRGDWGHSRGRDRSRRSPDGPPRRSYSPERTERLSSIAVVPRRDRSRSPPRNHSPPPRHHSPSPRHDSPLRSQIGHHEMRRNDFHPRRPSPSPPRGISPTNSYRNKPAGSWQDRGLPPPPPRRHSPPRGQLPPRRHSPPPPREASRERESRPFQQRPGPSPRQGERRRDDDFRQPDPSLEEVMIAEKVIAHGMETARPAWLGVPCLLEPMFLVISDGPLSRLIFDAEEAKRINNFRDSVDLTRDKPKASRVHVYNDNELKALSGVDKFFRRLRSAVGNGVPAHAYVIIGKNDARADPGMTTSSLREKIVKTFFDRMRSEFPGTDVTWAGVGGLPLVSPQCHAVQALAKSMDGYDATTGSGTNDRRPWLKCVNMCGSTIEEDLMRGGDSWTRQFAHVFGTNLCHRMSKDLKEFRMKRVRHLFNLPGPKCGVGVGNVTITDHR